VHTQKIEDIFKIVNSSKKGLTQDQVKDKQEKEGFNELISAKSEHVITVFLSQFTDFLVVILLVAGLISLLLKDIESAIVIVAVTVLNAILGTTQHIKAGKALESLKSLSSPIAKVQRNGNKIEIPAKEVVVGDIMFLEAGDYISADGRILENYSLQVNESSLTGESISVSKTVEELASENLTVGDRKNMVFTGGLVTYGRATIVVTQIGMNTEIGKIATLLESAQNKKTPLQINLDTFGKKLAIVIIFLCSIIFGINLLRGYPIGESFLFAVALAVAAIPEALSSIVTIVLAIGTQKMAKEHAIIRKLHAVESLGGVSVICSDKTGTLTQNKMVVKNISNGYDIYDANELDIKNNYHKQFLEWMTLCNDAVNSNGQEIGDPTEVALINLSLKYGINEKELRQTIPRVSELPFDSERKLMSTLHKTASGTIMITKGAIDVILSRATRIYDNNKVRTITEKDKQSISKINQDFSQAGLRVLGLTSKTITSSELDFNDENDLVFNGLIAMEDPPRVESKQAVYECKMAGIKPVMITGDHKITAIAIAKQIGILKDDSEAIEGIELDVLSDEQLRELVTKISVYARVSPTHKIRIVNAWQQLGYLVAMTGDGVNDAPALKQADIGVAMGKVGTEVAKESSDMILTDDNFATIVKAISNGRSIYANIKHSIFFLLSGNMAGILAVIYTSILALPLPFTAVHLLFINLITDSMPAIALGLESPNNSAMQEAPRDVKESMLSKRFVFETFLQGAVIAATTLAVFHYGLAVSGIALASTLAFSTLTLSRLVHGFNCRSNLPLHKIGFFSNKYQWYALITGTSLLVAVLLIPYLQNVFKISSEIPRYIHITFIASLVPLVVIQIYKTIYDYFNLKFSI